MLLKKTPEPPKLRSQIPPPPKPKQSIPDDIHPELKAAAISPTEAVIAYKGKLITAPMDQIDPDRVELDCLGDDCVLIPDDGNPFNDIIFDGNGNKVRAQPMIDPSMMAQEHQKHVNDLEVDPWAIVQDTKFES